MRTRPLTLLVLAALCGSAGPGCSPAGGRSLPSLIPVKGRVTHKGNPVTKGSITFAPEDYGREAHGTIQPDGSFVLTTMKDGDGVVAGHHRVTVKETGIRSPRDALARKWASAAASGLTADVDAEHSEFAFDLK